MASIITIISMGWIAYIFFKHSGECENIKDKYTTTPILTPTSVTLK